jgi:type II secretory pathway component GspD/PulD (secretin)
VRLDITVKVSLISGEKRTGDVTAPQYSDKSFKTTRVFPADGRTYLVGSFVSDSDITSRTGVPFLSKIPLIKYLFSQKSTTRSRSYALLTLAVGVMADNLSSDDLWRQQGSSTKSAAAKGKRHEEDLKELPAILDQALAPPEATEPEKKP